MRLGLRQGGLEIKQFLRSREQVMFTLAFPAILILVFGSIFTGEIGQGVKFTQYFVTGMIATGLMTAGFQALADRVGVITRGRLIAVDTPRLLGSRDSALATVSWRTPDGVWQRTQSATPTAVVSDLAARFDGEVPGLTVSRPTLEDIYLDMIGAS